MPVAQWRRHHALTDEGGSARSGAPRHHRAGAAISPRPGLSGFYKRATGTEGYVTDFPGLTKESATWLGAKGITAFTVESVSLGRPGRNNFEVRHVCRDMGLTHCEGVINLDRVVGEGRFRFIGFPPKIRAGTGSPVRTVAWLDGSSMIAGSLAPQGAGGSPQSSSSIW